MSEPEVVADQWIDAVKTLIFGSEDHVEDSVRTFTAVATKIPGQHKMAALLLMPALFIVRQMNARNKERNARLDALERRLDSLEAKPHVRYCGVWEADRQYCAGDAATLSGSLWISHIDSKGVRPGDGKIWQLAVKRGNA